MYDERTAGAPVVADEGLMVPADVDTPAKIEAVRELKTLLPDTEIVFDDGEGISPVTIDFVVGKTYVVRWNGVEYTATAAAVADNRASVVYVGNSGEIGGEDNGLPFLIATVQGQTMIYGAEETAVVGIRREVNALRLECDGRVFDMPYVEEAEGTVHQMDAKYLPFLVSPNGTKYKLAVADDGTLSAVAVE